MAETPPLHILQHELEHSILYTGADTLRGIREQSRYLGFSSKADYVNFLSGKTHLEIGSGYGGLAIEAYLKDIPGEIISVNPRIALPSFSEKRAAIVESTGLGAFEIEEDKFYPRLTEALAYVDQHSRAEYAHNLSFKEVFDRVIDCAAISFYANVRYKNFYEQSFQKLMDSLKRNGVLRSTLICNSSSFITDWRIKTINELGYACTPFYTTPTMIGGFEIVKE